MDEMEKLLSKAHELGHLLKKNSIVKRYQELAKQLEGSDEARKLLEEYLGCADRLRKKEMEGKPVEVEEKRELQELDGKMKEHPLISDFLATQAYYMGLMDQINDAIANPKGEPPRDSVIVTPGDDDPRIIVPK